MGKVGLQGILYDEKSSYLRGASLAPPLIREAYRSTSANFFAENGIEIRPGNFADLGDFEISQYFDIENITYANLKNHSRLISLGGDHSITYPVLKAFNKIHGGLDMLHIDAHADLYDEFEGDKYSHACPFARIMEDNLVNRLVQIGIRTLSTHQRAQAEKFDVETIEMKNFKLSALPKFTSPLYISLDIDALDPAFAPGVSHHEPGGLTTREVLNIIQEVEVPILGADIVEYNPKRDIHDMTAMVCAKFLKEILSKMLGK